MKQERIAVADMLPDKKNPRKKFEGIKELADSFAITPGRPGEPFTPPIVVQDGTKYRIVEGHRRHKAMKRLKTETCLAMIAEDFDEANAMAMMLATDEKQMLTDVEKSQGVQTMLLTGVDPTVVEKAAYLPKGSAKKIKTAMDAAGDGAEQMSMERLYAIAEFEGDEEAVKELSECLEGDIVATVSSIKNKRMRERAVSEFNALLEERGIEIVESWPDGFKYGLRVNDTDALKKYLAETDATDAKAKIENSIYSPVSACIYLPAKEKEVDPEEQKRKEERDRHIAVYKEGKKRRMAWIAQKIARPSGDLPRIGEEVEADEDRFNWQWNGLFELIGDEVDVPAGPSEIIKYMFDLESPNYGLYFYYSNEEYEPDACDNFIHVIDLLESEGYEPDESEAAMYAEAKAVIEAEEDEEADEENLEA